MNRISPSQGLMRRKDSILSGSFGFVDPNYLPKTLRGLVISEGSEGATASPGQDHRSEKTSREHATTEPKALEFLSGVDLNREVFSSVLVLYTGGTIGMKSINGGRSAHNLLFVVFHYYNLV